MDSFIAFLSLAFALGGITTSVAAANYGWNSRSNGGKYIQNVKVGARFQVFSVLLFVVTIALFQLSGFDGNPALDGGFLKFSTGYTVMFITAIVVFNVSSMWKRKHYASKAKGEHAFKFLVIYTSLYAVSLIMVYGCLAYSWLQVLV